jgi:hypothetical protein
MQVTLSLVTATEAGFRPLSLACGVNSTYQCFDSPVQVRYVVFELGLHQNAAHDTGFLDVLGDVRMP